MRERGCLGWSMWTWMCIPDCEHDLERDLDLAYPQAPTGRPYPPAAQAGPEGLGCSRRCVGVDVAVSA